MVPRKIFEEAYKYDASGNGCTTTGGYFYLPKNKFGKVLEIGCGSKFFADHRKLEDSAEKYVGIDIAKNALKIALPHTYSGNRNLIQACATKLPFKDLSFDQTVAIEVLTFLGENAITALQEIARVTKDKTYLFLTHKDYNGKLGITNITEKDGITILDGSIGDYAFFSEETIDEILTPLGFKDLEIKVITSREIHLRIDKDYKEKIFVVAKK